MKKLNNYLVFAKIFTFSFVLPTFITAADDNYLDNQRLVTQAEQFIMAQLANDSANQIKVEGSPIDERITIPACSQELEFLVSPEALYQSNITVKAQCPASNWYMFLMVKATEIQPVVVVTSALSPGTLLNEGNLQVVEMDKKRMRSTTFTDISSLVGARVKRRLMSGRPIEPNDLCFVCEGDSVVISAGLANMEIKTNGVALEDGNIGETIRVKNSRSNINLTAQVVTTNQVRVNL
ncbi:MAG: flagellar basal body P-ring formation chaperone FlgA [Paraglaciecola sp.]|uniref:flagellar basal body P-ring formation chaperone FlgA n=1 Tax=Paraglaciecola sp. TaxID=1920173 RepID=UPI00273F04DE|nr:flagellar basal body P-ring formation chaperone FlgA [Paraglaciecola sp.]MDP5032933.1 flagellar basal body P-ring formation chaperone FlgA [Paraglaciecola sp.]MDP5134238.1 flagellar basal body P-ring formation chaperone FlgA [Paraglaciecola sp.]